MGKLRNISKSLTIGTRLICACNSGAKKLQIIGFKNVQGTRRRLLSGGVGSIAVVTVKSGKRDLKKKVHYSLIVRQKYPYLRKKGSIKNRVCFLDNAGILLNPDLTLRKCVIKGVVAKEVTQLKKFSEIPAILR